MTKKDFELIAQAIKDSRCKVPSGQADEYARGVRTQHNVTALEMADALEAINARFDRERFLTACGVAQS